MTNDAIKKIASRGSFFVNGYLIIKIKSSAKQLLRLTVINRKSIEKKFTENSSVHRACQRASIELSKKTVAANALILRCY